MATVVIGKRAWKMDQEQVKEILKLASEHVPCGIYAIRKGLDYYEMMNARMTRTQLKKARNAYRREGIKVYCNGI